MSQVANILLMLQHKLLMYILNQNPLIMLEMFKTILYNNEYDQDMIYVFVTTIEIAFCFFESKDRCTRGFLNNFLSACSPSKASQDQAG